MENNLLNQQNNTEEQDTAFIPDDQSPLGSKIVPTPKPEKNIGIDVHGQFFDNIINAGEASALDIGKFNSFLNISQSRDQVYSLLDAMGNDTTVAAILETYAEDVTEYNDQGRIVWAESADGNIAKYVTFLLDTMNVDKHIYNWVYSLCKYGDLYLRLYRESEYNADPIFGNESDTEKQLNKLKHKDRETLNEDVIIKAYKDSDKFTHYIEAVANPAEMFELTKFGKTAGYIKANIGVSQQQQQTNTIGGSYYQYSFDKRDVEVYAATEFVHACLDDNSSRTPEEVELFTTKDATGKATDSYKYRVKRGQALLYNVFKVWRELMLLENSVLLNRVTKSSIVRVVGVEVGEMPKEMVGPHLQGIKSLIEQKVALNNGDYMNEYTNPGPVENNIYVPTHNGQGAITTQQIGGDVDVKSLADLDYFNNKFFGGARVPKQFFSQTDDSTGFNGGTSLTIISSRYAKMVKRIQNTMVQALTDAINIMLIDKGLSSYVNQFQLHMLTPATQEEIDRHNSIASEMSILTDTMNNLSDIENTATKLKIAKSMLSNIITNTEVIDLLQEEIDNMETEEEPMSEMGDIADIENESDFNEIPRSSGSNDFITADVEQEIPEEGEGGEEVLSQATLPTPNELNLDLTDNNVEI